MINDILAEVEVSMNSSVDALKKEFIAMRTGRASTDLVSRLPIIYYGTPTALQELALLSVPEPQLISIRPYDSSAIKAIEKAVMESDLGLNPNNDGKIIRLQIPRLTEERRRDLSKKVGKRAEEARISVRNARRSGMSDLKSFEKEKLITEDDQKLGQKKIQELTGKYIKKLDDIAANKEKEIMEV
ncbi:ribosome recycling factor [Anaerolineales bacterium HSG6]|nr:ribosome recycling factor [Anaerolineales bacterium HSG6]MDM8532473.1 ribosome recycling factor [Anaerolineales bacterium HSG25]